MIVLDWLTAAVICVAVDEASMIIMRHRTTRVETSMSADKQPGTDPDPCQNDDEDPVDVPTTNGSGGNGPPPPPVED